MFAGCEQTAEPNTTVQVWTNGVQAACGDPGNAARCYFGYSAAATPTITSVSPATNLVYNSTFYVYGSGFGGATGSAVFLTGTAPGGLVYPCNIWWYSADSTLGVTVPDVPNGNYTVGVVVVSGAGTAKASANATTIAVVVNLQGVSPQVANACGGDTVTISGSGFAQNVQDNKVNAQIGDVSPPPPPIILKLKGNLAASSGVVCLFAR